MCPAKTQISLGIRPVWSESLLSTWKHIGSLATKWAHSEDSDQAGRMPRLIWVFAGCTLTLFCHDAAHLSSSSPFKCDCKLRSPCFVVGHIHANCKSWAEAKPCRHWLSFSPPPPPPPSLCNNSVLMKIAKSWSYCTSEKIHCFLITIATEKSIMLLAAQFHLPTLIGQVWEKLPGTLFECKPKFDKTSKITCPPCLISPCCALYGS